MASRFENLYDTLHVSPEADAAALEAAYKSRVQQVQPERFHVSDKAYATLETRRLTNAYTVLSDPLSRRRFDRELARHRKTPQVEKPRPVLTIARALLIAALVFLAVRASLIIGHVATDVPALQVGIPLAAIAVLMLVARLNHVARG